MGLKAQEGSQWYPSVGGALISMATFVDPLIKETLQGQAVWVSRVDKTLLAKVTCFEGRPSFPPHPLPFATSLDFGGDLEF